MSKNYWAMRTSRNNENDRRFIVNELNQGRLRQGWGYDVSQDLKLVAHQIKNVGWESLSEDEKGAWGHWRFLGDESEAPSGGMKINDLVLVPNVPSDGCFTLCELVGPYFFQIEPNLEDFGHCRPVKVLTPGGVSNEHPLVSAGLRRSLRCRSRLWSLDEHSLSVEEIISAKQQGQDLRQGLNHWARAKRVLASKVPVRLVGIADEVAADLRPHLQGYEWETVIQAALQPILKAGVIIHVAGPSEKGADLEIQYPNPFDVERPWTIIIQVKDYDNEVGPEVAEQIE
jgi:hypothetical protein